MGMIPESKTPTWDFLKFILLKSIETKGRFTIKEPKIEKEKRGYYIRFCILLDKSYDPIPIASMSVSTKRKPTDAFILKNKEEFARVAFMRLLQYFAPAGIKDYKKRCQC